MMNITRDNNGGFALVGTEKNAKRLFLALQEYVDNHPPYVGESGSDKMVRKDAEEAVSLFSVDVNYTA